MRDIEAAFVAHVGSEPELKTSAAGKPWTSVNVAVGDGDDVQWLRLAVFGERAQELAGSLHKGDRIYAEGRLKLDSWIGKDGKERFGLKIAAWKVEVLGQIGHNKPAKPKLPPEGERPAPYSARRQRDWQRPAAADA